MEPIKTPWAEVDEQGRLILPPEIAERYGVKPGARLRIEPGDNSMRFHRPVSHLAKLYIETTDMCNLDCAMCIRSDWDEVLGRMRPATFEHIFKSLEKMPHLPSIFFGGQGEPLYNPHTIEWISRLKALGAKVELITNGTMLTEKISRRLVDAGLDVIWVSIDGATPESYADVRLGAELPNILSNVARLRSMRTWGYWPKPDIGIAFVAMRRNINDLPEIIKIGRRLGAKHFSVSNVLPYVEEMKAERLYKRTLNNITFMDSAWVPDISLPKMDLDEVTKDAFFQAMKSGCMVRFAGANFSGANDVCNFIESGSMSIRWDGAASPCWPLMHSHTSYLRDKDRRNYEDIIGYVQKRDLSDLWNDPHYVSYRERVQSFAFAPCTFCGGCELIEANQEDCLGNEFPVCGGCLWAQGVIHCP